MHHVSSNGSLTLPLTSNPASSSPPVTIRPGAISLEFDQPFNLAAPHSSSSGFKYNSDSGSALPLCDAQPRLIQDQLQDPIQDRLQDPIQDHHPQDHLQRHPQHRIEPSTHDPFFSSDFSDQDFPLFPASSVQLQLQSDQLNEPLFDAATMTTPQSHQLTPTPPHLLGENQPQSSPIPTTTYLHSPYISPSHFRHASLAPEAALQPGQLALVDWNRPQFHTHRRSVSEYSDVSSGVHSPNMIAQESFDLDPPTHGLHGQHGLHSHGSQAPQAPQAPHGSHSPLQQLTDPAMVIGISNFNLSDRRNAGSIHVSRSSSRSPGVSPRVTPESIPDLASPGPGPYGLGLSNGYPTPAPAPIYSHLPPGTPEAFPSLQSIPAFQPPGPETPQWSPPAINIDFAPSNSRQPTFDSPSPSLDQDSLSPPERGRTPYRRRAITDPYNRTNATLLSPQMKLDAPPGSAMSSRSNSPLNRQNSSQSRRRLSASAVPNNVIALRIADPDYQTLVEGGNLKRAQKNPATFQCSLCPKRFTRAYNLRSHLRTHTDDRPFVCTVCSKAFARQHDRKRHESLHSGEKKFVCKGELANNVGWGCSKRFHRADALSRHLRSETGRMCVKPLLDEELLDRQRRWQQSHMHEYSQTPLQGPVGLDANSYQMSSNANFALPAALLAQYPALAHVNWSDDPAGGLDDELSGRSSFDASDLEEGDDAGYVSGPGTGYGHGSMAQAHYSEMGYASDYGGR